MLIRKFDFGWWKYSVVSIFFYTYLLIKDLMKEVSSVQQGNHTIEESSVQQGDRTKEELLKV